MVSLDGKRVILTGASRGIGAAMLDRFVGAGADVVAACRSEPVTSAGTFTWIPTDVAEPSSVEGLFTAVAERWDGIDGLVNNAGAQVAKTVDETSDAEFDLIADVNMRGVFHMCRAAVAVMRTDKGGGGGSIVNVGSIAAETADRELAVYCASKAWVHGFTRAIAADHGRHGIRCNAVAPTWTTTEMSTELFDLEVDPARAEAAAHARHPIGRMAEPMDVANAAAWLLSDDAGYITGQCLMVDGGLTTASAIDPGRDFS